VSFISTNLRRCVFASGVALAIALGSCQSPKPGYRHEGESADQQLLNLVDRLKRYSDPAAQSADSDRKDQGAVDVGSIENELRRLNLEFPSHAPTLFVLANLTMERGRKERSAAYLDDLFAIQLINPEAGLLRSKIAIMEGNLNAASRVLVQQVRYTPDHPGLREALASVHFMAGRLEEAREELDMAERLGAPIWRVAFNYGLIEEAADAPERAVFYFGKSLEHKPDFAPARSRRTGLLAKYGDLIR
jgi:tetratricopeptide (TPR) repeat protein